MQTKQTVPTTPDLVKSLYERWGAAFAAEPDMPLDRWRAMVEEWPQVTAEPGGVDYVEIEAGGVPAMWITPKGSAEDRVIFSIHGGGFVVGSMYTHRKLFGHIAKAAGPRSGARLPPAAGTPAPGTGRGRGLCLQVAARPGHRAVERGLHGRLGRWRDGRHGHAAWPAIAGCRCLLRPCPSPPGSTSREAASRSTPTPKPTSC